MNLLAAWRKWEFNSPPFLLGGDEVLSEPKSEMRVVRDSSWESFISESDFGRPNDARLHLSLLPLPFIGDIEQAKVIVLLLNPGLDPGDYFAEFNVDGFRARIDSNLRQDFSATEYPFMYLDPEISWHPGFRWWHGKFQGIIVALAKDWGVSYAEARRHFAKIVACVELVPYHSVRYSLPERIRGKLRSTKLACEYVHKFLLPRSKDGKVLVVVMRQGGAWELEDSPPNVIVYSGSETRAAHLTPESRGGKAILKFLREMRPSW